MRIDDFGSILRQNGIQSGAGVPCSYFTSLVNYMAFSEDLDYVSATSEGEAVAIASGMIAGGLPSFALMQNSGLGNAINPITSMVKIYGIPLTLLISHRGQPGKADEPQHEIMGRITESLTTLCELTTHVLEPANFAEQLGVAQKTGTPAAWICRKGTLEGENKAPPLDVKLQSHPIAPEHSGTFVPELTREQALSAILPLLNEGLETEPAITPAVVGTTGKLSRELFFLDDEKHDKRNRFYMVGSMGCASAFALGVARARPERKVVVLDGDGALLMKFGTMATIGSTQHRNLHHVVFDNGAHDSTGGQPTPSPAVDFASVALACGYRRADTVGGEKDLVAALTRHLDTDGPTFLRVAIVCGSRPDLGRPTLPPRPAWERFCSFLAEHRRRVASPADPTVAENRAK